MLFKGVCIALLCVLLHFPAVVGHAFLAKPPARNVVAGDICKHCLQAGGPGTVSTRGSGVWPSKLDPSSHGLCGDPVQNRAVTSFKEEPYLVPQAVQAVYAAGTVVEFQVGVSTHHMGHYEFRLCNQSLDANTFASAVEGQACLDQWVLHRAPPAADCQPNGPADCQPLDTDHPERWYVPPPNHDTQVAGSDWNDNDYIASGSAIEIHTMRYVIPVGLSCEHCTLQWYWSTGNTCYYDEGYITYFKKMQSLGWDASSWAPQALESWATKETVTCGPDGKGMFAEEFWNCADLKIVPGGPIPAPTPAPPTPPTSPPLPTPIPVAPTPSPGPCSALWGQCGGQGWSGHTCCEAGSVCQVTNEWYSQCIPGTASTTLPAPMPQQPAPTPAPPMVPAPLPASGPAPAPSTGSQCICAKSTAWDGSFGHFTSSAGTFCDQNFGGSGPYISAGGGAGSSGGWSGTEPCSSGQYDFSQDGAWTISVRESQAQGKVPYRAFAYAQFCNGRPYSDCWAGHDRVSFSFAFMVQGMEQMGAYVKLLFWTDAGNIIGLLPPHHPKGNGQLRLVTLMNDDYPNSWSGEVPIQDGSWYQVQVDFEPATQGLSVFLDGAKVADGTIPVNMLAASSGPQIGIYSFDFGGGAWPQDAVQLRLRDACIGKLSCSEGSPGAMATSSSTRAQTTTMMPVVTALTTLVATTAASQAEPEQEPEPEPEPEQGQEPEPEPEPERVPAAGCNGLCGLADLSSGGQRCSVYSGSQEMCTKSFIRKGAFAVPCAWTACGCFADGEHVLECPNFPSDCASFAQAMEPGGPLVRMAEAAPALSLNRRPRLRAKAGHLTRGTAFIQESNVSMTRAELSAEELVDDGGMSKVEERHAEL